MKKGLMILVLTVFSVIALAACESKAKLTRITFAGAADNNAIAFDAEFNVLTGVTAKGDDGKDYTDKITYTSTATISSTGLLDTKAVGAVAVKYTVKIGDLVADTWRYLTVKSPEAVEGEMLINADFSNGAAGWTDPAVNYVADGAAMTITGEDGVLKVDVVAGSQIYTPRFGQMNVKFVKDTTYEISFKAKSSVEKSINLQVGELLAGAPYFVDFKPGNPITKKITTEWATYSYKFTMNLDNDRGGILFELGKLGDSSIDAILYFDDIEIKEATADADTTAPNLNGLSADKSILLNSVFDPMAGVSAFDVVDGDIDDITVVIKDGSQAVVTAVDTSVEAVYTLTYSATDKAGNKAEFVVTLKIVSMQFADSGLVVNGDFAAALGDTPEWSIWFQDWGTPAAVTGAINATDKTYELNITSPGDEAWAIQFMQKVLLTEGVTYKISFDVKSSVARDMNFGIIQDVTNYEHMKENGLSLTTQFQTHAFLFTALKTTADTKIEFDLGNTAAYAASKVTIDNVKLEVALMDELLVNTDFSELGWTGFHNDWEGSVASFTVVDGEFKYELTKYTNGSANYLLQLIHNEKITLEASTAYEFKFDAYAKKAMNLNPFFTQGEPKGYNNIATSGPVAITTTKASYTVTVLTEADMSLPFEFKFEFGSEFAPFETGSEWIMFDNLSLKKAVAEAPELLNNGTATNVVGWTYDNAGGGAGNMALVGGKAVATVTGLADAYQPHIYQMIDGLKSGDYKLKVVLTSSVARDLRINLVVPATGYSSLLPDTKYDFAVLANEEKVIYIDFTITNDVANEVKFEFDLGTLGGALVSAPGVFTFSEILLYQVIA